MNNDDVETIENCPKSLAAWKREVEKLRAQLEAERQRADRLGKELREVERLAGNELAEHAAEIAALKGDQVPLQQLFKEAIAWGRVYGPTMSKDLWFDMLETQSGNFAGRFTAPQKPVVPVGWEVCSPEWCNKHNACHEAPRIWFESEDGTGPHYHPSEYTALQKPVDIDADIVRDANRYRFLRDEDAWGEDSDSWDAETRTGLISSENLMGGLGPEHFDAAVDARMAASDIPFLNPAKKPIELTVWYGAMPESNGKSNFTAILHRKGQGMLDGMTIDRSEYPERVLYAADRVRYLIGEKPDRPYICNYDAEMHSGYVGRPKSDLLTRAEALAVETRALAESLKEKPDANQT